MSAMLEEPIARAASTRFRVMRNRLEGLRNKSMQLMDGLCELDKDLRAEALNFEEEAEMAKKRQEKETGSDA